jgi:hypothetical protein
MRNEAMPIGRKAVIEPVEGLQDQSKCELDL